MGENGIDVLVRGHDHVSGFFEETWDNGFNYSGLFYGNMPRPGVSINGRRKIICVGRFMERGKFGGEYAVLDEEKMQLIFRNWKYDK